MNSILKGDLQAVEGAQPAAGTSPDEVLTKKQLAPRLHVTIRTIENWQRRGVLPYVKVGKVVLFVWADVLEALRTNFCIRRKTLLK